MRIMHLSRVAGQFSHFMHPVINAQKRLGHYVCVCTADESGVEKLRKMGIEVFIHNMKRALSPLNLIKAVLKIRRILIEQKIDVIICHNNIAAGVGRIAAWLAKTRCIINFCHGFPCLPVQNFFNWYSYFFVEKILGCITDGMIVMNDYDENLCKIRKIIKDPDKILRIPGVGVDLDKFSSEGSQEAKQRFIKEFSFSKDCKIVISVTRLMPDKGVFVLMEAARRICAERDDVRFIVVGIGPSRKKLEQIIQTHHLEEKIKLLGWRDDVNLLVKASDIFILATFHPEGLPVSILEAMACENPVIATKYRGCEDIVVDGQSGFLVPVKQAGPVAEKINLLVDDEKLSFQIGQAARKRVAECFELEYCTEKTVEALEKLIYQ